METIAVSRRLMTDVLFQFTAQPEERPATDLVVKELREALAIDHEQVLLQARCFGSFRIVGASDWDTGPQPKRGRELIQYLVLHPRRAASREKLSECFWPDLEIEVVQHRLHIAASGARTFLREVLNGTDAIRCMSDGYAWHPSVCVLSDVGKFENLYLKGTTEAQKEAIALYSGELLEGEGADWVQPDRVKYATMYESMLERLADEAFSAGEFEEALSYGQLLLAVDRAHEGASRLVMRCFGSVGRRGRALTEYQTLHAYLRKHLQVDPMPETMKVIRSILGQDAPTNTTSVAAREAGCSWSGAARASSAHTRP